MTENKETKPRKPRAKKQPDVPEEVDKLLSDEEVVSGINDIYSQAATMEQMAKFLGNIAASGVTFEKVLKQSGFNTIGGHFKNLSQQAGNIARELIRANVQGRLKFTPGDFAAADTPPEPPAAE